MLNSVMFELMKPELMKRRPDTRTALNGMAAGI